ncbi:hypothetical protein [Bremerella sp. P1]|uniref:hypothetical protein n=1 Tax=Bremerella sp. P1 TaxID=3026424 RepID=UPI002368998C|nr:hypothetical protein [Bremerella sp. P1]WDI42770.1 hypothetical protein PSR63_02275 [Bremerella sp. P1]
MLSCSVALPGLYPFVAQYQGLDAPGYIRPGLRPLERVSITAKTSRWLQKRDTFQEEDTLKKRPVSLLRQSPATQKSATIMADSDPGTPEEHRAELDSVPGLTIREWMALVISCTAPWVLHFAVGWWAALLAIPCSFLLYDFVFRREGICMGIPFMLPLASSMVLLLMEVAIFLRWILRTPDIQ